jgi:hypothetical protein
MPHHWAPVGPGNPSSPEDVVNELVERPHEKLKYVGLCNGKYWKLEEITEEEAEEIRRRRPIDDCECILEDKFKKC